jgi:ribosome-associated toxin RatA of RatAB toxin-antitoxin module
LALSLFSAESSSAVLDCEPAVAYDILTDYDSYVEWMPMVSQSRLLAEEGDLAIAELTASLGEGETMAIECIHDRNRMVLSRAIGGSLPVEKIVWEIEPQGSGRCKVSLAMHPEERWQTFLPSHRRFLNPDACLAGLRRQVALFDTSVQVSGPGAELIFQLRETADGLMATYKGKPYKLTPMEEPKA